MLNKKSNFVLILVIYLAGVFMGAIDTGIITPARTVIQNNLFVDEKTGIWMITIYTLAYAASIPIMGKLADMFGRKYVYLVSIFLFGLGSLFCGLAQNFGSFSVLLIARTIQAIGGGGILPVATAEFGTTFPQEKRGLALGLVGGVYGIANIIGASAGSAILDIFGKNNWQFIFYINLPITLFILIAGFLCLPNTKETNVKRIDFMGITILTAMVLSLMYGLKNIDFFNLHTTFISLNVYPFLILFVMLLPLFIFAEKKAEDPVLNLSYFKNIRIIITLVISFITGVVMMGMIFVPQFSENALSISSGSGGYFVVILGLFAGLGAPLSGKLIDKYGPKIILGFGFLVSILGSLFLVFVTTNIPNILTVTICLILLGIGMGFTMSTPLTYMMLENTKKEESNSAMATLSLIRSIGTAIAPAIMIGFLAHAGAAAQTNIIELLPKEAKMPTLPYVQELPKQVSQLRSDSTMKLLIATVYMPYLSFLEKVEINIGSTGDSNAQLSADLLKRMQTSDVTTITENCKILAASMFSQMSTEMISRIQNGIQNGIDEMSFAIIGLDDIITDMQNNIGNNKINQNDLLKDLESKKSARILMQYTINEMTVLQSAIPGAFTTAQKNYLAEIYQRKELLENEFQRTLNSGFKQVYLTVTFSSLVALLILTFYRNKQDKKPSLH